MGDVGMVHKCLFFHILQLRNLKLRKEMSP